MCPAASPTVGRPSHGPASSRGKSELRANTRGSGKLRGVWAFQNRHGSDGARLWAGSKQPDGLLETLRSRLPLSGVALGLPRGGVSPPRWARPFSSRGEEALHSVPEEAPSSGGRQGKEQEEDACFGPLSMRTLCPRPGLATTVLTLLAAC